MLSRELMGIFALGVLWVNTLLVAAAALRRLLDLRARRASIAEGLTKGFVTSESFATFEVDQVGRHGAGSKPNILWHDKTYRSSFLGGSVDDREIPKATEVEVWVDRTELERAAACADDAAFDAAFPAARKARGFSRTVAVPIAKGREVWLSRAMTEGEGRRLVAAFDPLPWYGKQIAFLGFVFIPAVIAVGVACSALALTPPLFDGWLSKLGGLASFIYFLLVLPAGTWARDRSREPHEAILRGKWIHENAQRNAAPAVR